MLNTPSESSVELPALLKALSQEDTLTHNGALTNSTSLSHALDLFFLAGACRDEEESNIERALKCAWLEDSHLTMKIIFWAGDVRKGAGERKFFKLALKWLEKEYPEKLISVLEYVPVFSRWDSLFELGLHNAKVQLQAVSLVEKVLHNHETPMLGAELLNTRGLLAKWLPRQKQYQNFASRFRKITNINARDYRKLIVSLSNTVEQSICANNLSAINYERVPSVAMNKYRSLFSSKDSERFNGYIQEVTKGDKKINASAIFPHDIFKAYRKAQQNNSQLQIDEAFNAQWNSLPNYLEGQEDNVRILPICDTSGSMRLNGGGNGELAYNISVALGIYLSERNKSAFKDAFIIFSEHPELEILRGSFTDRVKQFREINASNTDLLAVFQLILDKALKDNLKDRDLPTHILIISDMEFDEGTSKQTNFQAIEELYRSHNYTRPNIIFWNCNGRVRNLPVSKNEQNVALVSGASPSIVRSVLSLNLSPIGVMLETLNQERYSFLDESVLTL